MSHPPEEVIPSSHVGIIHGYHARYHREIPIGRECHNAELEIGRELTNSKPLPIVPGNHSVSNRTSAEHAPIRNRGRRF